MTLVAWITLGVALIAGGIVVGIILAFAALARPEWDPNMDGFSDEEDDA